ncbi:heme oxygenase-like protein [Guyanagaster necrorhizus]|uniref:Heme oxygenase-like protein n=1 Tax=Guyanagaster necrorhizus TaxID=856835 RepID=A0A9P7VYF3_9AGAR|nr:heme oxygenase-like protein [Guyanagaster necrorhizus MCA 3950]KAG7448755.1 heme oxygenase-like protein [Guyanagaster necrorhizus MCA 3950]
MSRQPEVTQAMHLIQCHLVKASGSSENGHIAFWRWRITAKTWIDISGYGLELEANAAMSKGLIPITSSDLLEQDALRHPFLTSAASGSLQHERLGFWLSQDRLYAAHAYPRFIGSLISAIPYDASHKIGSIEERLNQRILDILVFSLTNVVREVTFFEETAKEWGLRIEGWKERKGTRDYTAEMARVSSSLEEGLVFLWAMEKVYLDSWVAVHTQLVSSLDATRTTPTLSALLSLSANWSSTEFSSFVDTLAGIVNDLGITPGSASWKRAEGVWDRVVELEAAFWPEEGEESSMLS